MGFLTISPIKYKYCEEMYLDSKYRLFRWWYPIKNKNIRLILNIYTELTYTPNGAAMPRINYDIKKICAGLQSKLLTINAAIFNSMWSNLKRINYDNMQFCVFIALLSAEPQNLSHLIIHFCPNKFQNFLSFYSSSRWIINIHILYKRRLRSWKFWDLHESVLFLCTILMYARQTHNFSNFMYSHATFTFLVMQWRLRNLLSNKHESN